MADKLLRSIKFPTLPDRYVIGDSTLTEEGAAAEAKAVGDALATKADTKGTYEDLIVGGAEQLMSDEYETDKEPYLFRPTGGSADVGNREYLDKIVGGTVAWNQLVENGDFGDGTDGWGSYHGSITANSNKLTFTATTQSAFQSVSRYGTNLFASHKYFYSVTVTLSEAETVALGNGSGVINPTAVQASKRTTISGLWNETANRTLWMIYLGRNGGLSVGATAVVENVCVIDLTAMFGSTIADYIYSLEQANAGAGVAWFRKLFPKPYYAYNAGELMSVNTSAHNTVGFNQWDEEWEVGDISYQTGQNATNSSRIRSKNYIHVIPNATHYIKSSPSLGLRLYDEEKNYIGTASRGNDTYTIPSDVGYIRFIQEVTTYNHDICINLSDPSRNGEYEPYTKHSYPLDSSLTLRGIPKLDANNKLYYDGDTYESDGSVTRKYGIVDLGTLGWIYDISVPRFYSGDLQNVIKKASSAMEVPNALCPIYQAVMFNWIYGEGNDKGITVSPGGSISVKNTAYTTAADFKTAMSGVYLVYELATPTTETVDGYEQYQICDPSGTEEFVTTGIVPVGHETRYPHDLKKKVETAPDSPSTDGTYLMKRSGGKNTYMALPSTPSANGAYVLTVTVSGGSASYSWTAKE